MASIGMLIVLLLLAAFIGVAFGLINRGLFNWLGLAWYMGIIWFILLVLSVGLTSQATGFAIMREWWDNSGWLYFGTIIVNLIGFGAAQNIPLPNII